MEVEKGDLDMDDRGGQGCRDRGGPGGGGGEEEVVVLRLEIITNILNN